MRRPLGMLLLAESVSTTGSWMTYLALPWFVLISSGSPLRMTFVMCAEIGGYALLGLPSGTVLARLGARRTMILADALRTPVGLVVPVLHWTGGLSYGVIVAVGFTLGALSSPYGSAQRMLLAELAGDDEALVGRASALFQGANRLTYLLGPAIGGVLIAAIGAPSVLLVDAGSFAAAVVLVLLFVPARRTPLVDRERTRIRDGLRYVLHEPLLRAWTGTWAISDAAWQAIFAAVPVLVVARYAADPRVAGWLFAGFGVGCLAGNVIAFLLMQHVDGLRLIARFALGQALPLWALGFRLPELGAVAALAASGLANGLTNPAANLVLTLRPPPALRAHALTAILTLDAALQPLGVLVAGPLLQSFDARWVFVGAAAVETLMMAGMAVAAAADIRSRRPQAAGYEEPEPIPPVA